MTYSQSPHQLGRPLATGTWGAPENLRLADGRVKWSSEGEWRQIDPPTDLLDRVTRLVDADDETVADFARSYGLLLLCARHRLPHTHSRIVGQRNVFSRYDCPIQGGRNPFVEVETYRALARKVRAIINLAAMLHMKKETDSKDWAVLGYDEKPISHLGAWTWESTQPDSEEEARQEREVLGDLIDEWLDQCDLRPRFGWHEGRHFDGPSFQITAAGLRGAVAMNVVLAVTKSDGFALCTSCKGAYAPRQKPKTGRNNYCPGCRGPGRWRDAKRRARAAGEAEG
jgi:hypothetical protein